jgi:hypothetical protein
MYGPNLEAYAMALWYTAWPDVDWYEASDEDKKLFRDHAHSLYTYDGG